jgi:transposase
VTRPAPELTEKSSFDSSCFFEGGSSESRRSDGMRNGAFSTPCFRIVANVVAIANKRQTVNGILWVLHTGAPWGDLPERDGNWNSAFARFTRWSKLGVWGAALRWTAHSLFCSSKDGSTRRTSGKMPTTSVRRLISPLSRAATRANETRAVARGETDVVVRRTMLTIAAECEQRADKRRAAWARCGLTLAALNTVTAIPAALPFPLPGACSGWVSSPRPERPGQPPLGAAVELGAWRRCFLVVKAS